MNRKMLASLTLAAVLTATSAAFAQTSPSGTTAFAVTTNFSTGSATRIRLSLTPGDSVVSEDVAATSRDPIAVFSDGLFVLHRAPMGDKANTIEKLKVTTNAVRKTFTVPAGSNPQDVERVGNRLFVSLLQNGKGMRVCSVNSGDCSKKIDLCGGQPLGSDGNCEATQILRDGSKLYVLLQLLDAFSIVKKGRIAVVDIATEQRLGVLKLSLRNPSNLARLSDGRLLVTSSGSFFPPELSGGVEVIDPNTGIGSVILDDDTLGGNVADLALVGSKRVFVIVSDATTSKYRVVKFNAQKAIAGEDPEIDPVYTPDSFFIGDIEADGAGSLLVADSFLASIVQLNAKTGEEIDTFSSGDFGPQSVTTFPNP